MSSILDNASSDNPVWSEARERYRQVPLGLQLCRALLARAGGSLVLDRDGESGTTFVLSLPAITRAESEAN